MQMAKVSALAVLMMGVSTVAWAQSGLQTKPNEPRSPAYQTPNPAGNSGQRGAIENNGANNPPMTETGRGSARGTGNTMDRDCSNKQLSAKKGAVGCGPSGIPATKPMEKNSR